MKIQDMSLQQLVKMLEAGDNLQSVIRAIAKGDKPLGYQNPKVISTLKQLANKPSFLGHGDKELIMWALGNLGDTDSIKFLAFHMSDDDESVRLQAAKSIYHLASHAKSVSEGWGDEIFFPSKDEAIQTQRNEAKRVLYETGKAALENTVTEQSSTWHKYAVTYAIHYFK